MKEDAFLNFVKQLSFNVYQHKGDSSFKIEEVIALDSTHYQYIDKIHELIQGGFFFLEFAEEGKYKKIIGFLKYAAEH